MARKLTIRWARASEKASGIRAGGSQSEIWPSRVWPDMYSSNWIWPMG